MLKRLSLALVIAISFGTLSSSIKAQDTFQLTDPTLNTPAEYTISSVVVEGEESTREQFIINASALTVGSTITYPGEDIADALKRLFRTGLFADVQILIANRTSTEISLIIRVEEKPRLIEYKIEGVKRSQRRDLEEMITLLPGTAITESNKAQVINTIQRFYKNKGYWYTKVETRVEEDPELENRARLYFDIDPGVRLEIKDIKFEGNEAFSDRKLTKKMKPLKEDKWWKFLSKKVYKESDFEEGKESVLAFYRKNGYTDARIVDDSVYTYVYVKDLEGVRVVMEVEEGPQYKIRNINWDGNTVYTDEQLTEALGFEKGEVFNEEKFDENFSISETSVNSMYQNIGYLFFRGIPTVEKVAEDSLDISFEIYEDEIATIEEVSFTGNTKTHDDVVRRTLRTVPGSTYSREAIIRTIRELGTLGYFDPQNITPELNPDQNSKTVDVNYVLDESVSTDNFEFSGGYGGQQIGAIISARINFNNFSIKRAFEKGGWAPIPSGDGQQVSLGVQVTGGGYQSYSLGFVEPWLGGKPTSLGVNLSYNLIDNKDYVTQVSYGKTKLFSGSVSLGKRLKWPDDYFSQRTILGYQLYDVEGFTGAFQPGISNVITVQEVIERNSIVNPISPIMGSKFTLSGEIALPLKGFSEFYKIKADYQSHFPLTEKLVFTTEANFGYIGYFTQDKRNNYQRFLIGGTQLQQRQSFLYDNIDMRGYPGGSNESIGPIVNGRKVGGRIYNKFSAELRYPAVQNEQLQLIPYTFVDAGNAYLDFSEYDPFNVKRSAGVGVRLFLPILGLVDLSYGYRFDGVQTTSGQGNLQPGKWEFLFNIGAPF
ncbi:outer membrane protein assembly factor BamA [Balneola vulgaris]|uniref:outer membrane protein assembly factor BamA n=1 Tax=Balneola vulgaris TaxID=287535 RepID=UPI000372D145|nr:outer membrane protein assembly factor BamA [Balneola vulgaris]